MPAQVPPRFNALVQTAAEQTDYPALFVEKDYWICLLLEKLVREFEQLIIFKGGTSLSKAWQIINRFSEDVDILLDSSQCQSKNQKRKQISNLRKFIENIPGFSYLAEESIQGDDHGSLKFAYQSVIDSEPQTILVEAGFRGGVEPTEICSINSIIGELIEKQQKGETYKPFSMRVLHPHRTLIEKLYALAGAYEKNILPKKTRHYYDIFCLLKISDMQDFLASPEFTNIASDIERYSQENFEEELTLEAVCKSQAFNLKSEDYQAVKKGYESDKHLYFRGQPKFDTVYLAVSNAVKSLT